MAADFDLTVEIIRAKYLSRMVFDSNSSVTSTQAGAILTDVLAEVNGMLISIGITPSDIDSADTVDYPIVRKLTSYGWLAEILRAIANGPTDESASYQAMYDKLKKEIRQNPAMLDDNFSADNSSVSPRSHVTVKNMTDSGDFNDDLTPPFRTNENF